LEIHNGLELKRRNLESRIAIRFPVHRGGLVVEIMLLLRNLQSTGNL
jgi:hypothetical protein